MYVHANVGDAPIILTVPHDGEIKIPGAPTRATRSLRDLGTLPLARAIDAKLRELGLTPTLIWCSLHRTHVDPNRPRHREPCAAGFEVYYECFHKTLGAQIRRLLIRHGYATLIDIHGATITQEGGPWDLVIGTNQHKTSPCGYDRHLAEMLRATHNTTLGRGYDVAFSPDVARGMDSRYSGGWIVQHHGSRWGANGLEAIQIEFNRHLRQPEMTHELAHHLATALSRLPHARRA